MRGVARHLPNAQHDGRRGQPAGVPACEQPAQQVEKEREHPEQYKGGGQKEYGRDRQYQLVDRRFAKKPRGHERALLSQLPEEKYDDSQEAHVQVVTLYYRQTARAGPRPAFPQHAKPGGADRRHHERQQRQPRAQTCQLVYVGCQPDRQRVAAVQFAQPGNDADYADGHQRHKRSDDERARREQGRLHHENRKDLERRGPP